MPKTFVQESTLIKASRDQVFDYVTNLNHWSVWSPWLCVEPTASVHVSSDGKSVGSVSTWDGEVVGKGENEIKVLDPGKRMELELRIIKPWKSTSEVLFDFEDAGDETKVTWTMNGSVPWFMFWMKSMLENMIGMDYDRGLRMLKEQIETGEVLSKVNVRGVQPVGPIHMVGVRKDCSMETINKAMDEAICETMEKVEAAGVETEGCLMAVYHEFDPKHRTFGFTAGAMLLDPNAEVSGLSSWSCDQIQAFQVEHIGCYDNVGNGWSAAYSYVRYKKLKQSKMATFEIYRNDPSDTPTAELITDIFLPLR